MKAPLRATLPTAVKRAIVAHARRDAPRECCGFLAGKGSRVMFALPMTNCDPRPRTGFRIDPSEHLAIRRVLRQLTPSVEIVGVYHSHPNGPATPSPRDIAESHYPEWLFVIVGAQGRSVRGFRIAARTVRRVQLGPGRTSIPGRR